MNKALAGLLIAIATLAVAAPEEKKSPKTPLELEQTAYTSLKKLGANVEHKLMKRGGLFIVRGPKAKRDAVRKVWMEYWKAYEELPNEGLDPTNADLLEAVKNRKVERDNVDIEDGMVTVMLSQEFMVVTKLHRMITERQHKYQGKAE